MTPEEQRLATSTSAPEGGRTIPAPRRVYAVHDDALGVGSVNALRAVRGQQTNTVENGDIATAGAGVAAMIGLGLSAGLLAGRDN